MYWQKNIYVHPCFIVIWREETYNHFLKNGKTEEKKNNSSSKSNKCSIGKAQTQPTLPQPTEFLRFFIFQKCKTICECGEGRNPTINIRVGFLIRANIALFIILVFPKEMKLGIWSDGVATSAHGGRSSAVHFYRGADEKSKQVGKTGPENNIFLLWKKYN